MASRHTRWILSIAALAIGAGAALAETAPRTEKGQTLVVPEAQAAAGKVYFVLPGKDGQITFTSDAPFEHIKGTSNRVIGYAIAPTDASQAGALISGEFVLPVASMQTGIPMRDEHLQSEAWLHAEAHPDITFTLKEVKDADIAKQESGFTTWAVTLVGDMTIHGVTRPMSVPARITSMPESEKTRARAKGDLLAIRCEYAVKLSDFGVAVGSPAMDSGKVSDEIQLDTFLLLSTVSPEAGR